MSNLTAVSLFAGVGGFDLAMQRAGISVTATVEINKAANSVLERWWPFTPHFTDIKEVTGEQLRNTGFVPDRGVLVGGFPCQDVSVAGKRAGLAGNRSGLYWEIVRLIDELSPRWVVLENVPGLLSSGHLDECEDPKCTSCDPGRDFGAVLGSLVERGYGVSYRILDAQYFGVAQRRDRVFIVGCLGDRGGASFEVLALAQGVCGDTSPRDETRADTTESVGVGFTGSSHGAYREGVGTLRAWGGDLAGGSETLVAQPLTAHHPRANADENLVVADTLRSHPRPNSTSPGAVVAHTLTAEYDASEDGTGRGVPLVATTITAGGKTSGRRQEDDFNLVPYVKIIRSGARDENGELPAEVWAERDTAPTMNAMDNTGDSRATVLVGGQTAVRRLTPLECERLQGFPDGFTDGQSDSARYRQMGNAVCVNVAEWIFKRLVEVDER